MREWLKLKTYKPENDFLSRLCKLVCLCGNWSSFCSAQELPGEDSAFPSAGMQAAAIAMVLVPAFALEVSCQTQ
jgi:hypothetical protein